MANSADLDQLAKPTDLDLHCLQRQGIPGFSWVKSLICLDADQFDPQPQEHKADALSLEPMCWLKKKCNDKQLQAILSGSTLFA